MSLLPALPIHQPYTVSVPLALSLGFTPTTRPLEASYIARDPIIHNDTAPGYTIYLRKQEAKLRETANDTKGMAAAL